MIMRFDENDENIKERISGISGIGKKIDAHVFSIKNLTLHMYQLSTTVNPCKPGTLPSNTIKCLKNNGHFMEFTTRVAK